MRAIMIMFDTLSKRFLSNFGNEWIKTPNFQRLQKKMITFDNFYGGSLPCIPARRELHTGMYNFPFRSWGPLEVFDQSAIEKLKNNGVYAHIVTDHSHYWEDGGATYLPRYSSWEGFRGQEGDRWVPRMEGEVNQNKNALNKKGVSVEQHMANITRIHDEKDISSVQTINAGIDFLEKIMTKKIGFFKLSHLIPMNHFMYRISTVRYMTVLSQKTFHIGQLIKN